MMTAGRAADVLLGGGVIAYPTEGVFGLGCLPDDIAAVERLLEIKERDAGKGLILIAARPAQFSDWIDKSHRERLPKPDVAAPVTWLVRPSDIVPAIITGDHESLAVRITTNPVAAAICDVVDMPIISTSANIAGQPVARNSYVLRRSFAHLVDYIVPGECGPASGASEIRDLESGTLIRPGQT
ncbi:MAG: Sua5/YciO/YrdC/YwlC family protein [Woeseiaceae bacterium]|nr:Sua5/YciO/YrdC/YwlC family protein [Woeseiaceae bacterium]